jgi:tetratricopeptide (TPR) repeat protein
MKHFLRGILITAAFPFLVNASSEAEKHFLRGEKYYQKFYFSLAKEEFLKACQLAPDFKEAYQKLALTWLQLGKPKEALKCYQKLLELEDSEQARNKLYQAIGDIYLRLGDTQNARRFFEKLLTTRSFLQAGLLRLGKVYQKEGKYKEAIEKFREGSSLRPNSSPGIEAQKELAKLLSDLGRYEEAILEYEALVILLPREPELKVKLGYCYLGAGENKKAISILKKALQEKKPFWEASFLLVEAYIKTKAWLKAEREIKHLLKKSQERARAYQYLGYLYTQWGKLKKAIKIYQQLKEKEPQNYVWYTNLGLLYLRAKMPTSAITSFRESLKLNPNQENLRKLLEELEQGK